MIKKLDKFDSTEASIYHVERLYAKVNEIIHELNLILEERESQIKVYEEAQDMYDNAILDALKDKQVDVVVEPAENVQDKFAEQRKWIGKLCWVWDDDGDERTFAKLTEIIEDDDDRPFKCFARWKHCEPVKPDDDIIYKGDK